MTRAANSQLATGYRQISEDLRQKIAKGGLRPGAALPSEAALARRYQVSRMTVRQGLKLLESDGLLRVIPGKGRQVASPQARPAIAARDVPRVTGRVLCLAGGTGANFTHPYLVGIHEGMSEVLRAAGVEWDMRFVKKDEPQAVGGMTEGDHVGILVVGLYRHETFDALSACERPVVFLNSRPLRGGDAVTTDNYAAAYQAASRMVALGHRRVGHINRKILDRAFRDRHDGLMHGLDEAGIRPEEVTTIWGPEWAAHDPDGTIRLTETLKELRSSGRMPTAFFACTDDHACRLIGLLTALGMRVPEDVSVVGFDNYVSVPGPARPEIATFEQPGAAVGRRGAEKLLRRMADPSVPPSVELIAPKWIEGKTLAAPRSDVR